MSNVKTNITIASIAALIVHSVLIECDVNENIHHSVYMTYILAPSI